MMEKIAMLFNGLGIDYGVAAKSLNRAGNNKAVLEAVFLMAAHDKESNYPFPNDLDAAESLTGEAEAEKADTAIIQDFINMLKKDATNAGVAFTSTVLENPSAAELELLLKDSTVIYAKRLPQDDHEWPVAGINLSHLLEKLRLPVEFI
jgi:hypothetical protein